MVSYIHYELSTCPVCKETLVKEAFTTKKFTNRVIRRSICRCATFVEVKPLNSSLNDPTLYEKHLAIVNERLQKGHYKNAG